MEALILRRNYPAPVTFADLRRAHDLLPSSAPTESDAMELWAWSLKEATGAHDDIYVVADGAEHYVGRIDSPTADSYEYFNVLLAAAAGLQGDQVETLLQVADEAGYWERPREVRVDFQGRVPTLKAVAAVAERSRKAEVIHD